MQTIYRPGHWYLIVIPGALVALPPDVPGDVIARLWEQLPTQKTLATVVDVLTAHAGGSFAALPAFAAAVAEGADVRIALRGDVSAQVQSASGDTQDLSGVDVMTWSERFVTDASRIDITVESAGDDIELPVQSGVVRGAGATAELESGDADPLTGSLGPSPVVVSTPAAPLTPAAAESPDTEAEDSAGEDAEDAAVGAPIIEEPTEDPADEPASDVPAVGTPFAPIVEAPSEDSADDPDVIVTPPPSSAEVATEALDVIDEPGSEHPASDVAPDAAPEATLGATGVTLAADDEDFDQLWGATVHSVPSPPVAAPPAPPVAAPPVALPPMGVPTAGDHDGATISAAELRALRQQPPIANDAPTAVLPVTDAAVAGRIRVSTGQVVSLDRTVIVGRRPRSSRASGANLPHLVAVESPQQDISRSHLEIRPEGDTVVVIDLHTTNGSTLLRPGADPMRLHPGEQTLVLSGDVVDLGDGVTVAFEDLP